MQLNKTEKQLILVDLILFSFDKDYKVVTLHFFCATWSRCGALPRLVLSGLQRVARPPPLTKPNTRVRARNAARDTHQAVPINPAESTRTGKKTLGKNSRRLRKEWQESPPPTVRVFHSFSRLNKHSASVIWRMCLVGASPMIAASIWREERTVVNRGNIVIKCTFSTLFSGWME